MLQLPNEHHPLEAAMILRQDAVHMGVRLPVKVQLQLLNKSLEVGEPNDVAVEPASEGDAAEEPGETPVEPGEAPVEEPGEGAESSFHLKNAVIVADALAQDGHVRAGASSATLCSVSWLLWHLRSELQQHSELFDSLGDLSWSRALELACGTFHSQVGFSSQLPRPFFQALEASSDPEAQRMVKICRRCFGRFYPS
eukprot:Skav226115  [mRNA]  locus=scaffold1047:39329:40277:- [translate_table: standard]